MIDLKHFAKWEANRLRKFLKKHPNRLDSKTFLHTTFLMFGNRAIEMYKDALLLNRITLRKTRKHK